MKRPAQRLYKSQRNSHGFTLVEMSVVLVLVGLIVGVSAQLIGRFGDHGSTQRKDNEETVIEINRAIRGFILANSRLPCPDLVTNGTKDGVEDCNNNSSKVAAGYLPVKTLGLYADTDNAWRRHIAYGISRTASAHDLGTLTQGYNQVIGSHSIKCLTGNAADCDVSKEASITTVAYDTTAIDLNLLDFCTQLDQAASAAATSSILHTRAGSTGTIVNIAYGFALPGSRGRLTEGQGGYLESDATLLSSLVLAPELGKTSSATNDDHIHLRSFADLYKNIGCPERISGVEAAYFNSYAHVGNEYLARVNLAATKIQLGVAESDVESAERDVTFGTIGIALATADLLISVAELSTLNAAAVAGVATATAELANATANLVLAKQSLDSAKEWVVDVKKVTTQFREQLLAGGKALDQSRKISLAAQARGAL